MRFLLSAFFVAAAGPALAATQTVDFLCDDYDARTFCPSGEVPEGFDFREGDFAWSSNGYYAGSGAIEIHDDHRDYAAGAEVARVDGRTFDATAISASAISRTFTPGPTPQDPSFYPVVSMDVIGLRGGEELFSKSLDVADQGEGRTFATFDLGFEGIDRLRFDLRTPGLDPSASVGYMGPSFGSDAAYYTEPNEDGSFEDFYCIDSYCGQILIGSLDVVSPGADDVGRPVPAPVPAPMPAAMLLSGLGVVGAFRGRKAARG